MKICNSSTVNKPNINPTVKGGDVVRNVKEASSKDNLCIVVGFLGQERLYNLKDGIIWNIYTLYGSGEFELVDGCFTLDN